MWSLQKDGLECFSTSLLQAIHFSAPVSTAIIKPKPLASGCFKNFSKKGNA